MTENKFPFSGRKPNVNSIWNHLWMITSYRPLIPKIIIPTLTCYTSFHTNERKWILGTEENRNRGFECNWKLSYNRDFDCFDGELCKEAVESAIRGMQNQQQIHYIPQPLIQSRTSDNPKLFLGWWITTTFNRANLFMLEACRRSKISRMFTGKKKKKKGNVREYKPVGFELT